jgi:hypothetical protein
LDMSPERELLSAARAAGAVRRFDFVETFV